MTESRAIGRHAIWLGMALCVVCIGYFYALDHVLFSSANFSPIFRFLLRQDAITAWLMLAICIVAALWNKPAPILLLVEFLGRHPGRVALTCAALYAVGALVIYHQHPLSMDEYAAVFQAKIFASGHLSGAIPPSYLDWLVLPGFNGKFLIASHVSGRIIEEYWPGFAALLAPFEFLEVPWLCNAALSGLALYLIGWIVLEITGDQRAVGWALLFALASGAFIAGGISYYSMQAHLTLNLLFAALLLRASRYRAAAAGLVGSLALNLHNPMPHALFALPWLLALVWNRDRWRYVPFLILGYLPGLLIGWGWLVYRSEIGAAAHTLSTLSGTLSGVFTWPGAAVLNMRAASLAKMWLWASPCVFVFALLGFARYRDRAPVRLLAASAILTLFGYFFVALDQGHGWGYRYFHSAWGVIPVLAGCALASRGRDDLRLVCFAGAAAILSAMILVPFQMSQIQGFISRHLAQLGPPLRPGNNVYFIHPGGGFYVEDLIQTDPFLRAPDLFLLSRGSNLDTQMILENWPNATKVGKGTAYDQWYLGPLDQRRLVSGEGSARFLLQPEPR
jgi:hypothetical protein